MQISKAYDLFSDCIRQGSYLGLSRIQALMDKLGNPQDKLKFIHIAGTNGKGSIAAMLSSILSVSGYKTGLYTSPSLVEFNERIQCNGAMIPDNELTALIPLVRQAAFELTNEGFELPSEFEFVTALGFLWFNQQMCDIVVLEVGLGGRLDATNVIKSTEVAVIAAIDFDHTKELGDTLDKIAAEKAEIIKFGCDVVQYQQDEVVSRVIEAKCNNVNAILHNADFNKLKIVSTNIDGQLISYKDIKDVSIPLLGVHQPKNAAVVFEVIDVLKNKGYQIDDKKLRNGLKATTWHARLEVLQKKPLVILDGGHNPHGVKALAESLIQLLPEQKFTFVCGILQDKDSEKMLSYISPLAECIITLNVKNARALQSDKLAEVASRYCDKVFICNEISDAFDIAFKSNNPICCFGSLYMAGEVLQYFNLRGDINYEL